MRYLPIMLCFLCLCWTASTGVRAEPQKKQIVTASVKDKSVQLILTVPETSVAGNKVPVWITMKNLGKKTIYCFHSGMISNYTYNLETEDGKEAPYTARFKRYKEGWLICTGEKITALEEGKELSQVANLSSYFDLSVPGEYVLKITCFFRLEKNFTKKFLSVVSKEVKFKVVNGDKERKKTAKTGPKQKKKPPVVSSITNEKNIEMTVSVPKFKKIGTKTDVSISCKNTGKKTIYYDKSSKYVDYIFELKSDRRYDTVPTRFYKSLKSDSLAEKAVTKALKAGETFSETVNLSRIIDLSRRGEYTLTVTKVFYADKDKKEETFRVKSKPVKFDVI